MLTPKDWGPHLWSVLHGVAEGLGNQTKPMLATDEANEFVFMLRKLGPILPCPLCREHYAGWLKEHRPENLLSFRGIPLREACRSWLYAVHNHANSSKNVPIPVKLEEVAELYKSTNIAGEWDLFETKLGLINKVAIKDFKRHLVTLRRLVGR